MNSILRLFYWSFGILIFILGLSLLSESVIISLPLLIEGLILTPVVDTLIKKRFVLYGKWKALIIVVLIPGCFIFNLFNYSYVAKAITNNKINKLGGLRIVNNEIIEIFNKEKSKFKSTPKVGDLLSSEDAPLLSLLGNNVKYSNGFRYEMNEQKIELPHIYISCGGLLTYYSIIIYDPRDTMTIVENDQDLYLISHNIFIKKPNPLKHLIHYFNTK